MGTPAEQEAARKELRQRVKEIEERRQELGDHHTAKLYRCQTAYRAGNLTALLDALIIAGHLERDTMRLCSDGSYFAPHDDSVIPVPRWAVDGALEFLVEHIRHAKSGKRGRHSRWLTTYREARIEFERGSLVELLREDGVKWDVVYNEVQRQLKDTYAAGTIEAIRRSYLKYKKNMKTDPKRYWIPQFIRVKGIDDER